MANIGIIRVTDTQRSHTCGRIHYQGR